MGFKRASAPVAAPAAAALTSAMAGIGMSFATAAAIDPNVEDTLWFASVEGMERGDLRVLGMLTTWVGVHAAWVNVDRLTAITRVAPSARVRAYWAAMARWQHQDRRWARLAAVYAGPRLDVLAAGAAFQVARHGEDARLAGGPLRVPANLLPARGGDVVAPAELARHHVAYRYRLMMGPSYRADMWAALDDDDGLSAAALARQTYGSFATAWHVKRDHALVAAARRARRARRKAQAVHQILP